VMRSGWLGSVVAGSVARGMWLVAASSGALAVGGCGDDGGPGDDDDDVMDGGPMIDEGAPTVVSTRPVDGETNVDVTPEIVIAFSEEMDRNRGSIEIDGTVVNAMGGGNWNVAATEVTFAISRAFDPDTLVTVTVQTDFVDAAGNALADPVTFSFTTVDEVPPFVITTVPEEGSSDALRTLSEVAITFNEPMTTSGFTVGITGGDAALAGDATFDGDADTLTIPIEGLDYDTDYTVTLDGFTDAAGNAWDPVPELDDGNLDFATGPDMDPPQVVSAMPMEGQVDVDPDTLESIVVTFDEPMDRTVTLVQILTGPDTVNGAVSWDETGTVATVIPQDVLAYNAAAALVLTRFRDVLGNEVADDASGGNGRLDFVTGPDMFPPGVREATPDEGATGVALDLAEIVVTFTEAMDTTLTTFFLSKEGEVPVMLEGTWEMGGVRLRLPVPVELVFRGDYMVDLTDVEDVAGNGLAMPDEVTEDGVLDFQARGPTGENCDEVLRIVDGTTTGGKTTFNLAADELSDQDGGTVSCDGTAVGPDAVFVYEKTTASLSDGGALLHVRADSLADNINVEVVSGACAPAEERFAPEQLTCLWARDTWDSYLDVGPGTYYIFVADGDEGEFDGFDVEIEELSEAPAGESCLAPYTTASSIHSSPSTGVDRWSIPADDIVAFDMDRSWGGPGSISCDDNGTYGDIVGVDAVIEVEKASADSLLEVSVSKPSGGATDLNVEILEGTCDPTATPRTSRFCSADDDEHTFQGAVGYAGTVYVWVTAEATSNDWPEVQVDVEEISPVAVGEACGRGTALASGSNTVSLGSAERFAAPTCFGGTGDITWFEYTLGEEAVAIDPNGTGNVALVRPADGFEYGCAAADDEPLGAVLGVGETVCFAVANGGGTTSIEVTDVDYTGVSGTPTDLRILPPLDSSGDDENLGPDRWMAVSDRTLWMVFGGDDLMEADLAGGRAILRDATDGISSTNIGYDGFFFDGSLYSVDDTSTGSNSRLYELWDGVADPWAPSAIDTTPSYVSDAVRAGAPDGTDFFLVSISDSFSDPDPTFYEVPGGGGTPTNLGANGSIQNVVGMGADDTYFFVLARNGSDEGGVFRVTRSSVTTAAERLSPVVTTDSNEGALVIDATTDAAYLYFKATDPPGVHVIKDPGGATPRYLGRIFVTADNDFAIAYDGTDDRLYVFDTLEGGTSRPRFLRFD